MADNYLEKKMEEHRRGGIAKSNARRLTPSGDRLGTVSFRIEPLRIFVTDGSSDYATVIICRLRAAGCNVAFFSADEKNGRELAQKSGARFYPASFSGCIFDDIAKAWSGLDGLVVTDGKMPAIANVEKLKRLIVVDNNPKLPSVENSDGLTVNGVNISGRSASDVAHLCLMLCLNASVCINNTVM
ncbi:MAG: hypothetical protein K2I89_01325 [Muribaculaceae bacterium]|nr:hypothetical protein [Muribaculaceae bacterium]